MVSDRIRHLALVLVVVLLSACTGGSSESPAGAQPYGGPIFRGVTTYVEHGEPYDFSHGVGADDAARAADIASSAAAVGHVTEVGLIAPSSAKDDGCGSCVQVALIDYDAGVTHNVIVDVATDEIFADAVQDTVVAALGEDGIRSLYGIALHDPEVADAVGDVIAVSADVSPFTQTGGSCSQEQPSPHRCASGTIYFPGGGVMVYVDLTDHRVVEWTPDA